MLGEWRDSQFLVPNLSQEIWLAHRTGMSREHHERQVVTDSVEKLGQSNLKRFFQSPTARRVRCFGLYPAQNNLRRLSASLAVKKIS